MMTEDRDFERWLVQERRKQRAAARAFVRRVTAPLVPACAIPPAIGSYPGPEWLEWQLDAALAQHGGRA